MKTKVFIFLAALSFSAATSTAQEAKTMYIMKNGGITHEIAVSDIDSVIFYKPSIDLLTYDEGVIIGGIKWATRNVDKPGTFTANPEDPGMFYQWNSKVGWKYSAPLTPSDGTSTWKSDWNGNGAASWEKSNDPCPAGWRMPSQGELNALRSSGSVWMTVNSMNGRRFGSGSNTVFLPAAGHRVNVGGTLDGAGSGGYYWSSTALGYGESLAYYLHFGSGSAYLYNSHRANGISCRCVAE